MPALPLLDELFVADALSGVLPAPAVTTG
jgi:hypothetical protein